MGHIMFEVSKRSETLYVSAKGDSKAARNISIRNPEEVGAPRRHARTRNKGNSGLIIYSVRAREQDELRALSFLVWALRACKAMIQSRGAVPFKADDPALRDTPGAQQLDTSLHAVPSMCPSMRSGTGANSPERNPRCPSLFSLPTPSYFSALAVASSSSLAFFSDATSCNST